MSHPMGALLILGMMIVIFLGPEWVMGFIRGHQGAKRSGQRN